MTRLGGLVLALLVQPDPEDSLWKFEKGRIWIYHAKTHTRDQDFFTKYTEEVVEAADAKIRIKLHSELEGGGLHVTHDDVFDWTVKDGFLVSLGDGETDPIRLYQVGVKKGQSWKTITPTGEKGEAKVVGTEEVKVMAGTFKNAIHVEMSATMLGADGKPRKSVTHCFIVPKIGLVKLEWKQGEVSILKELIEVKEPR